MPPPLGGLGCFPFLEDGSVLVDSWFIVASIVCGDSMLDNCVLMRHLVTFLFSNHVNEEEKTDGVQWLSVRVLDSRPRGSSLTGVTALWSLSKTHLL